MGTESSIPESKTTQTYEHSISNSKNAPIVFHGVHGDNIVLEKHKTVASRPDGFCKGIVFSNRPIKVRERIYIKFVDISSNWNGALRIGFTTNDPSSMKSKLPLYACPNLTTIEGNWVKAISERMAQKDSVLYYYVQENGDVYYGIDSMSCGFFFGGVNTREKMWAVLDVYGNTLSIELINPYRSNSLNNSSSIKRNRFLTNSENDQIEAARNEPNKNVYWEPHVHGKNIHIEQHNHAYRKNNCKDHSYIFLSQSLRLGWRIALEVLQISSESNGSLVYGVTTCNPASIKASQLPNDPVELVNRPEDWVVMYDSNSYQEGDILLYSIDKQGDISVRKNKDKFESFHVGTTLPMWLFFNVTGRVSGLGIIAAGCSDEIVSDIENLRISDGKSPGTSEQCGECVICCDRPTDCALYKCGHMCLCYKCAKELCKSGEKAFCPICRKEIQDVIKVYK